MKTNSDEFLARTRLLRASALCLTLWTGGLVTSSAVSPPISPWETNLSEDFPDGAASDSCVELASSGETLHCVWVSTVGSNLGYLNYRRSTDGGATWQARVVLQPYPGEGSHRTALTDSGSYRLAVDGGDVHIVQKRYVPGSPAHYEIDYFRSTDGGATFDAGRTIVRAPDYRNVGSVRIAVAGGRVAVAYGTNVAWDSIPNGRMVISQDHGATFTDFMAVPVGSFAPYDWNWGNIDPMDVKWQGQRVVSLWKTNGTVPFFAVSSNEGATSFSTTTLSTAKTEAWSPAGSGMLSQMGAVTNDGASDYFHAIWNQRNSSGRSALFYARSIDHGATFEAVRDLSEGTIGSDEVRPGRVAMVAQGTHVYVCYVSNGSGALMLRSSSDSGFSFGPAVPLHLPGMTYYGNGDLPVMALDPADASGASACFAFTIPAGLSNGVRHTTDGGATLSPLLMAAVPYVWDNSGPNSFRLCPVTGGGQTAWSLLNAGIRQGYSHSNLYFRQLAPSPAPTAGDNRALRLAPSRAANRLDMAEIPSTPALQFTTSFTAELWVRVTSPDPVDAWGTEVLQWGNPRSLNLKCINSNYDLSAEVRTTGGTYTLAGGQLGDRNWHHIAISYDSVGGPSNLNLYVDGTLKHALTATGDFVPSAQPLLLGGTTRGASSTLEFVGEIDNLRLWNTSRSWAQIRAGATRSLTGLEPGLAAAWSFESSIRDLKAGGADGFLLFGADYVVAPGVWQVSAPALTGTTLTSAAVGRVFHHEVVAPWANSFTASPVPPGLSFDNEAGVFDGTPTVPGVYDLAITASNAQGTAQGSLRIVVLPSEHVVLREDFNNGAQSSMTRVRPDDAYLSRDPSGALDMRAHGGDLWGGSNSIANLMLADLPATGDFTLTLGVSRFVPPQERWVEVFLSLYDDDDNYLRHGYGWVEPRGFALVSETARAGTDYGTSPADLGAGPFLLRLTKQGPLYQASYSVNGVDFTPVMQPVTWGDGSPAKAGFWFGIDPTYNDHATIDSFEVRDVPMAPQFTGPALTTAMVGSPFAWRVNGPTQGYSATGLPPGLEISAGGLITGTPTQAGVFDATVLVSHAGGSGSQNLRIVVEPADHVLFRDDFTAGLAAGYSTTGGTNYYSVAEGLMKLRANNGDTWTYFNRSLNFFSVPVQPTSDWVATLSVASYKPNSVLYNAVRLNAWQDTDNNVWTSYGIDDNNSFYREKAGVMTGVDPTAPLRNGPFQLRIVKTGNTYHAYRSTDGVNFQRVGDGPLDGTGISPSKAGFWFGIDPTEANTMLVDAFDVRELPAGTLRASMHAMGLTGASAEPDADPDGDGIPNIIEYACGTSPVLKSSKPAAPVTGTVGEAPGGPYFTLTIPLAKPVPADIEITGEFSMDLGNIMPWMSNGVDFTDTDAGDHINRTFRAPFIIGSPPSGFMRVRFSGN
ncbi:MAG: putative Ig domain-containing protein [Verrucomicrobia bacterium]|nr:putative Ig domain-containing protein [Verrucomicrobiota bacterium]